MWTTVSYQFGKDKGSRLDWQNVPNPSPTYYRNLPSYFTTKEAQEASLQDWLSGNPEITQINWEALYKKNINQLAGTYYGNTGKKPCTIW